MLVINLNLYKGGFPPKGWTTRVTTQPNGYHQYAVGTSQVLTAVPFILGSDKCQMGSIEQFWHFLRVVEHVSYFRVFATLADFYSLSAFIDL